ncbi:exopolysaccharide biosynthesis protein [Sphingomicrobium nitratireducens]|uniref:exopolysaccharide biosynthesis protein n=1 Tax=Sphingomicrobium nitratireducens TaxID=2964666 RepID=UPI00223ED89C|nr:exopolysaccharide biosynthesis protein [Sphingomicrobium nitratireducens]
MSVHFGTGRFGVPHSVGDVLRCLEQLAAEQGSVSISDVVDALGTRTYGPMLMVPALMEITPIGAIPGVPTFLAFIIAIVAIQMLVGSHRIWLPSVIEKRSIHSDKLDAASRKLEPLASKLDHWFHGRLRWLTHGFPVRISALVVIGLCATVPPLEFLPFASSGPMLAIAAFGLALLVRDGALILVAIAIGTSAAALGIYSLMGSAA